MFKIITLAVVIFTVVLLHGAYGNVIKRDSPIAEDEPSTKRPKLIRVPLFRHDSSKNPSRSKRDLGPLSMEFFNQRLPRRMIFTRLEPDDKTKTDDEFPEDFFHGFEGRELEDKLAETSSSSDAEEQAEATESKSLTDDEKQRFDVETTSAKIVPRYEEFEALKILSDK